MNRLAPYVIVAVVGLYGVGCTRAPPPTFEMFKNAPSALEIGQDRVSLETRGTGPEVDCVIAHPPGAASPFALAVKQGVESACGNYIKGRTVHMTPEMQSNATQIRSLKRQFEFQIASQQYELNPR
jgi:hypothetical protein